MTKKTYIIIAAIIVLIIAGFAWWMRAQKQEQPQLPVAQEGMQAPTDTTATIQKDLADINVGETDFKDVDATIKGL